MPMPRPDINKAVFAAAAVGVKNESFQKQDTPEKSIPEENKEVVLVPVPKKTRPKTPEPKVAPLLDDGVISKK